MEFTHGFANNKGLKIHYIDNNLTNTNLTPLLICPGLSEAAEDYVELMTRFKNRRCIALSFRGRGKSNSPSKGYTLEHHVEDICSVVDTLELEQFCIMGISRGVSYELGYAVSNYNSLKGVIISEYPPEHKKMPNGWAKESMDFYNEYCETISITYDVLDNIEKESEQIYFSQKLKNITCPVLILKGELDGTLLRSEDIINYVEGLGSKSIRIERFDSAGHDIQAGDFEGLVKVMNEYLSSIDQ